MTATASTAEKLDWLLSLPSGATHVANYKTQDFLEVVKKVTDNKGVDVIIDFVGQSHWGRNIESLAIDGRMTLLALLSGNSCFPIHLSHASFISPLGSEISHFDLKQILYKRLRIQGSTLRSRSVSYQADLIERYVLTLYHPLPTISKTNHPCVKDSGKRFWVTSQEQEEQVRSEFTFTKYASLWSANNTFV